MISLFLKKIFGTAQSRLLKKYEKIVREVNRWEIEYQSLSDLEVRAKTALFRERLQKGESLDSLLPEAYAVVKNVCRRLCGTQVHVSGYDQKWDMIPYDVQILGAIAMHRGSIAEMQTGEGKTLTAAMPLYLNALTQKPVHLVTVNDYLAERDCAWIGAIFRWLGLTTRALVNEIPPYERKEIYAADIVYGTASEFGFDYLRDNSLAKSKEEQCQRGYFFAIIDEIDSILIDEARTPLIISGPSPVSEQMYEELKEEVSFLVRQQRDLCNSLATQARKTLEILGRLDEKTLPRLDKEKELEERQAFHKLWLVSKGTPHNKILKRMRENPDIRAQIEKWDTYYYGEPNKEERASALAELYIVVDERASEYELTDKGIQSWIQASGGRIQNSDFEMLDLGEEYAKIDEALLSAEEKLDQKVALREEDARRKERSHNLRQLLRAHLLLEKDVDYIVEEGKIIIIDENTGRPQPGRRFSDGLHQAIEAKEGVLIQGETQTYATITLQNYFRLYEKRAGMTGTAMTEANEFKEIYKLDVVAIPTYRPSARIDEDDEIYMTEREKYSAILRDIQAIHAQGRPILIGTESVEVSEKLARILRQNKLEPAVLNAKNHAREAEVIARAGMLGALTVATNMAGRGTDIKLAKEVIPLGGLHVIGTTRHQSRRIDRQLRGRSARLGDPGSSKFYVSFEDALMRLFTSPRITAFLQRFRPPEGEPITAKILNKSIETAQKRVEQRNYTMRKHTLEYDNVMNKQREEIYAFRNEILSHEDPLQIAEEILEEVCVQMSHVFLSSQEGGWDPEGYRNWLMSHFPITFEQQAFTQEHLTMHDIETIAWERVRAAFTHKKQQEVDKIRHLQTHYPLQLATPMAVIGGVVRSLLLHYVDTLWQEHLLHIDHLRTEVHVRAIGQKDPLLEFKHEAFILFDALSLKIRLEIAHALFRFHMEGPEHEPSPEIPLSRIDLSQLPLS